MKNKRGNVAVVAIIIVIVAITAGITGWMFAKKSQAPAQQIVTTQPVVQNQPVVPTPQPASTDETASWQTYSNAKYGFEFKYPQFLSAEESSNDDIEGLVLLNDKTFQYGGINVWIENSILNPDDVRGTYGKIERNNLKTTIVGGVTSYEYQIGDGGCRAKVLNIPAKEKTLKMSFSACGEEKELDIYKDKIISTFKFTNNATNATDLKISKGWLEGTRSPLNLVLAETTVALSGYSGNKFALVFSKDSMCTFPEAESSFSCTDSKIKWGIGDRVRVYGSIKGDQILVNKLEIISTLPIEKW